jgi:DNA adenine methylase
MDPIIKWPGGKSSEYEYIHKFFPSSYDRYVEPFFGGGAVYFKLMPPKAVINDICKDLMNIYRYVASKKDRKIFSDYLFDYSSNWHKISKYTESFETDISKLYGRYKQDGSLDLKMEVSTLIKSRIDEFNSLFSNQFCIDRDYLEKQIVRNLVSKLRRTTTLENNHGILSKNDLEKNIETAFRSGFYMHFRDVLNYPDTYISDNYKKAANFYFIREFCYGGMFRFNKEGKFNIPYGGIAYNSKNLDAKITYAVSDEVHSLLSTAEIYSGDFWDVLSKIDLTENDFLFLDPPYDTGFSDYNDISFDQNDQRRLADFLYTTKAQFVLVIKNTPFITSLYANNSSIFIDNFDKSYQYNVRGRNNRDVNHLIVRNFQ